ncbi:MAG: DEAD/DEAH box helicase family protein, partial [Firmicutes bacterium]|nr:DEAD/DEAH box helicase family protein [Bacillota bacterium]
FLTFFRGREDLYAKRWESRDGKKYGYGPACRNEWLKGLCAKPHIKCGSCKNHAFIPFDKQAVARHLAGKDTIGVYPLLPDETCLFLAIDFDGDGWRQDVSAARLVCERQQIPIAVERSRSGYGAHLWLFFAEPVPAVLARKLGSAILTATMEGRHELKFTSYDRMFPSQDTMPQGGFGNLIALPLQRTPRNQGNSLFIDEQFLPYADQWAFLSGMRRLTADETERYIALLCQGGELGSLYRLNEDESTERPWDKKAPEPNLNNSDFPAALCIVEANMLYIDKEGFSQRALNRLKRLAAFKNPAFYKAQAMRLSTWDKPRVISISDSDETGKYLCLPRGCKVELSQLFESVNVPVIWQDERNPGRPIDVSFNGVLRDEQETALKNLLAHDNGILSATTAFGKTIVSIALIAKRRVNVLVLVDRQPLLEQWQKRLAEFLTINEQPSNEKPAEAQKKRGRKKEHRVIGRLGGGKNNVGGIIDIALIQSLAHGDEVKDTVKDLIKDYGMVIIDECHHVPAVSFERVLKEVNARYIYGLTATPKRQDGHHPILYMHCGQIRYQDDAKLQAERRPFEHFVIPRFTSFRVPIEKDDSTLSIQALYTEICQSETRNNLIVADVLESVAEGRNPLILTGRKSHVESLERALKDKLPNVITLVGGQPAKERKELAEKLESLSPDQPLVIIATGKYVGEGFDAPRLDTLFLAMPIAWQGTLAQYAGRLHRLHDHKHEVRVYDYVDVHIAVLDRMYAKRVKGYALIGYQTKGEVNFPDAGNIIFDSTSFLPVFRSDLLAAKSEILLVSPFVTKNRVTKMLPLLDAAVSAGVKITVLTRPVDEYKETDRLRIAQVIQTIREHHIAVVERPRIHQKFAVFDGRTSWYGSINLLSFGRAEESIMRLESKGIAGELMKI